MSIQGKSSHYIYGSPSDRRIVAQIYFPYKGSTLDLNDRRILQTLIALYTPILFQNRVELSFVGHADHRGSSKQNLALGEKRARAVRNFVDGSLKRMSTYSSWFTASMGETFATRLTPDENDMALDRRVDIYSTWVYYKILVFKPMAIKARIPSMKRISERCFSKLKISNIGRPVTSGSDYAWKELFAVIKDLISSGGKREQFIYGKEDMKSRKTKYVPAFWRVNKVRLDLKSGYETKGYAEIESVSARVWYTWGPPQPNVTVQRRYRAKVHGRLLKDKRSTKLVPRSETDKHLFLTPPKP